MLIKKVAPDFTFDDERGSIVQLVHEGYRQVNTVFTKKGSLRGNMHYHSENKELFFVISGKVIVTAKLNDLTEEYTFSAGDMFLIEKGIRHHFVFLSDTQLIGLYDIGVESKDGKDILID